MRQRQPQVQPEMQAASLPRTLRVVLPSGGAIHAGASSHKREAMQAERCSRPHLVRAVDRGPGAKQQLGDLQVTVAAGGQQGTVAVLPAVAAAA